MDRSTVQDIDIKETLIEDEDGVESSDSYSQLVWQRFSRSNAAIVGGLMVITLIVLALLPEFFSPYNMYDSSLSDSYTPPTQIRFFDLDGHFHLQPFVYKQELVIDPVTYQARPEIDPENRHNVHFFTRGWEYELFGLVKTDIHLFGLATDETRLHLLGTDRFGRDLWGRICLAGRVSLSLSILAAAIAIVIGSSIGVVSGYYGGAIDNVMQRFVEVVMSFPELPLWMALVAVIPKTWSGEQRFLMMVFIFPFLRWAVLAREVRGKVLSLRETDFILAAKEQGAGDFRIIFKHLYPNVLSHVIVILTLMIPQIILAEAFLSFLGIGIQEPLTSWGFLMKSAQSLETLGQNTWILTPVIFIVVAVLGLNFLGDGLRDAADPYSNL